MASPTPADILAGIWNTHKPRECPKWLRSDPTREAAARKRLKEEPNEQVWIDAVKRMERCPFLRGTNERGWKADPSWFLKPSSLAELLEGKFEGTAAPKGSIIHNQTSWTDDDDAAAGMAGERG